MRASLLLCLAGCWTTSAPPQATPRSERRGTASTCDDAVAGIERAIKDLEPDPTAIAGMRERCVEDAWSIAVINCFRWMGRDDLGTCANLLAEEPRDKLFAVLSTGSPDDRAELAIAVAQLKTLSVGIPECDNFVLAVGRILECKEYPLAARVQLGRETVDFWALPNNGRLPADAIKRMALVCDQSRGELEQRAVGAGCKL